jgi:uncharacterized membrane protein
MIIEQIANFVAPWHDFYASSKIVPTVTESVHLLALLFGGGLAVAADRTTRRLSQGDAATRTLHLQELSAVHRPVLMALAVSFVSGVALVAADVDTLLVSPFLWAKLGCVTLLLVNGWVLTTTEGKLRKLPVAGAAADTAGSDSARLWDRLRFNANCSMGLWAATLIAGVALCDLV